MRRLFIILAALTMIMTMTVIVYAEDSNEEIQPIIENIELHIGTSYDIGTGDWESTDIRIANVINGRSG